MPMTVGGVMMENYEENAGERSGQDQTGNIKCQTRNKSERHEASMKKTNSRYR
jgi:hypothetical protein